MSKYNPDYDEELCPDGICTKFVKKHFRAGQYRSDCQGICGGKLIRVYVRYSPRNKNFGDFKTWEELSCSRCGWKKRLRLISKRYVKPKNEIWVHYEYAKTRRKNDRREKSNNTTSVDRVQKEKHDDVRANASPMERTQE